MSNLEAPEHDCQPRDTHILLSSEVSHLRKLVELVQQRILFLHLEEFDDESPELTWLAR